MTVKNLPNLEGLKTVYTKKFGEPGFIYAYDNITSRLLGKDKFHIMKILIVPISLLPFLF